MGMRYLRMVLILSLVIGLAMPAWAMKHLPEERGKTLFNDPGFAGGKKACNECHKNGKGLENSGMKTAFKIMGKTQSGLEEAVNYCIVNANGGKAIKKDSNEMKDIVAYIKTLGGKPAQTPGYGAPGYK